MTLEQAQKRIAALEAALLPFAEAHKSLQEWKCRYNGMTYHQQDAWPKGKPVFRGTYPCSMDHYKIVTLWPSHFEQASKLVGALVKA